MGAVCSAIRPKTILKPTLRDFLDDNDYEEAEDTITSEIDPIVDIKSVDGGEDDEEDEENENSEDSDSDNDDKVILENTQIITVAEFLEERAKREAAENNTDTMSIVVIADETHTNNLEHDGIHETHVTEDVSKEDADAEKSLFSLGFNSNDASQAKKNKDKKKTIRHNKTQRYINKACLARFEEEFTPYLRDTGIQLSQYIPSTSLFPNSKQESSMSYRTDLSRFVVGLRLMHVLDEVQISPKHWDNQVLSRRIQQPKSVQRANKDQQQDQSITHLQQTREKELVNSLEEHQKFCKDYSDLQIEYNKQQKQRLDYMTSIHQPIKGITSTNTSLVEEWKHEGLRGEIITVGFRFGPNLPKLNQEIYYTTKTGYLKREISKDIALNVARTRREEILSREDDRKIIIERDKNMDDEENVQLRMKDIMGGN